MNSTKTLLFSLTCIANLGWCASIYPPDSGPWPKSTPESQGMSSARLNAIDNPTAPKVAAIVIRNGYEVWRYRNPDSLIGPGWASCNRSILVSAFAMQVREGLVPGGQSCIGQPVNQINCPTAKSISSNILLKHLLSNTACSDPPGTEWKYACMYTKLRDIVAQLDGEKLPIPRMVKLTKAIGASNWKFNANNSHPSHPFVDSHASCADAARWGYLWLNRGKWRDKQLIDAWFVDQSLERFPGPNGGYVHNNEGWKIHMNRGGMWGTVIPHDAYAALGAGYAVIMVIPSLNLVIAYKGDQNTRSYEKVYVDGEQQRPFIIPFFEEVVKAVSDTNVAPSEPTQIVSPAHGDTLQEGRTYALIGKGENLQWSYDANSDGMSAVAIGTGSNVSFTVPTGITGPRTLTLTLSGDGGAVSQTHLLALPTTGTALPGKGMLWIWDPSAEFKMEVYDASGLKLWDGFVGSPDLGQKELESVIERHKPIMHSGLYYTTIRQNGKTHVRRMAIMK